MTVEWRDCGVVPGVCVTTVGDLPELLDVLRDVRRMESWCDPDHGWGSSRFFARGIWFRGQRLRTAPLPTIRYRKAGDDRLYDEASLFNDFRMRLGGRPGMPATADALAWLSVMRHYDMPCRVLDWTVSALVALHFAVADDVPEADPKPHVWVLNARALNEVAGTYRHVREPLTRASVVTRPWIWEVDSFSAALRAEQAPARFPGHMLRLLDAHHSASRGYPGSDLLWKTYEAFTESPMGVDEYVGHLAGVTNPRVQDILWSAATPGATQPPWNNPRIQVQKGFLTVHGGSTHLAAPRNTEHRKVGPPAVDLAFLVRRCADPGMILRRIDLAPGAEARLRQDLLSLGLEYHDLLPEVEHQVRGMLLRHDGEQER